MSDHQAGPGWWLASDGKWYPPELHPDAPSEPAAPAWAPPGEAQDTPGWGPQPTASTSVPPWSMPPPSVPPLPTAPAPSKRSPWPLAAGIVVVLIVIGAVAALATRSSRDSSAASDATTSEAATSTGTPPTGPSIHNSRGDLRLTLPTGWVGADVENGAAGAGAQLFPDDPTKAAAIEQRLSLLPRATVLFGVDGAGLGGRFTANVNVASDPTAPISLSLDEIGRAEAKGTTQFGATVVDRDTVALGGHEAYRFTYTANGFGGIAFVVKGTDSVWIAIYTVDSLSDGNEALADGSAATLVVP